MKAFISLLVFLASASAAKEGAKGAKSGISSSATIFSSYEDPFYSKTLEEYRDLRIGGADGEEAIWHYKGIIRNPITGNEVVGVEGS